MRGYNLEMSHYLSQPSPVFLDLGAIGGTDYDPMKGIPFHTSSDEHFNGL